MIAAIAASLVYDDHGRRVHAVREVTLSIEPGSFVGILGPSGSGKSSLLYLLSGLKNPTSGRVEYLGKPISACSDDERSRIRLHEFGFVFQQPYLIGYLTALENVLAAQDRRSDAGEAMNLLERLGLGEKAMRRPHELSGGERQRVCVARALLGGPKVIFADEPTAALDHTNGLHVMRLLNEHRGAGALVVVTHDRTMLEDADSILTLEDGAIVEESPQSEFRTNSAQLSL